MTTETEPTVVVNVDEACFYLSELVTSCNRMDSSMEKPSCLSMERYYMFLSFAYDFMRANKINEHTSSAFPIYTTMLHKSIYHFLRNCFVTKQLVAHVSNTIQLSTPQTAISLVWNF